MGVEQFNCCTQMGDTGTLRDLPKPNTEGMTDQYMIWEYGLPFKRVPFLAFKKAVMAADRESGGRGYVTIDTLKDQLIVPGVESWKDLANANSDIVQLLLSDLFKDDKRRLYANQIDTKALITFGLLHCADRSDPRDKAMGFFDLLQDGGIEKHQFINFEDRDLPPRFARLCKMATTEVFSCPKCPVPNSYSSSESTLNGAIENIQETWLDDVHGDYGTLKVQAWLENVCSQGYYIFDVNDLRQRIFKEAGVDYNYGNPN